MVYGMKPETLENVRFELRRGSLILAVLAELQNERYGYLLRKELANRGLDIDQNTLYPLENGGAKLDHRAANRSCFWAE